MIDVKIKRLPHAQAIPAYQTLLSAGVDLVAAANASITPGNGAIIPTGICVEIPPGYEAQVRSRSGLAVNNCVFVLNSPGTIDADYRGEIKVILYNIGLSTFHVSIGDRIAQLVFSPVVQATFTEVDELGDTVRGTGGFGSTGV